MNFDAIRAALTAKSANITATNTMINGSSALAPVPSEEPITTAKAPVVPTTPAPDEPAKPTRKRRTSKTTAAEEVTAMPRIMDINTLIAKQLVQGRDYDLIAGCKKPSLLKAGAEKLASIFGYYASAEVIHRVEMYDKNFVSYEIAVTIKNKTGTVISQGIGSCNSREKRYLKGDFCCQLNTVLKMAKKRAFVDAILTATGASGVFTQDIEDIG